MVEDTLGMSHGQTNKMTVLRKTLSHPKFIYQKGHHFKHKDKRYHVAEGKTMVTPT